MKLHFGTIARAAAVLAVAGMATACQPSSIRVDNSAGTPTTYIDPGTKGPMAGVGIEGQDIISMSDAMIADMLLIDRISNAHPPARVIIDAKYFKNESSQALNKDQIIDRLRIGLERNARGKIQFVNRERADMVEMERDLKRAGKVDVATTGMTRAQAGADYRLSGRISSQDMKGDQSRQQRYNMISFEMTDLESGLVIWSNYYEFSKFSQDNIMYR